MCDGSEGNLEGNQTHTVTVRHKRTNLMYTCFVVLSQFAIPHAYFTAQEKPGGEGEVLTGLVYPFCWAALHSSSLSLKFDPNSSFLLAPSSARTKYVALSFKKICVSKGGKAGLASTTDPKVTALRSGSKRYRMDMADPHTLQCPRSAKSLARHRSGSCVHSRSAALKPTKPK